MIGLAPLFIALAGLGSTVWRRAGLAAAGLLWLVGVEVISGDALLYGAGGRHPGARDLGRLAAARRLARDRADADLAASRPLR